MPAAHKFACRPVKGQGHDPIWKYKANQNLKSDATYTPYTLLITRGPPGHKS